MIREVLSKYPMGSLNGFGMLLFLAVFTAVVIQVLSKKNKAMYEEMASLPFSDPFSTPDSGQTKDER